MLATLSRDCDIKHTCKTTIIIITITLEYTVSSKTYTVLVNLSFQYTASMQASSSQNNSNEQDASHGCIDVLYGPRFHSIVL